MMIREYFNMHAQNWDETAAEKDSVKLGNLAKRLSLKPGNMVLDIGTGTGVFLPYILREINDAGRIIALDIADKMLAKACQKSFGGRIEYVCGDATEIPLEAEVFNAAVCYSSFAHFADKKGSLFEIRRVLTAGGQIIICHTSSRQTINNIHSRILEAQYDMLPAREEMLGLLSSAGFVDLQVEDSSESYFARGTKLALPC